MPLTLVQTVPPVIEPISIADVKMHIGGTFTSSEDGYINSLIATVRESLEIETRRQINTATFRYSLDEFPGCQLIKIPRPPLVSITHIKYQDTTNVEQTLSAATYGVDVDSEPGRIYLMPSAQWPSTLAIPNAVRITYIAGWPNVDEVPWRFKHLSLLVVADLYANRLSPTAEGCLDLIPYIGQYTRSMKIYDFF